VQCFQYDYLGRLRQAWSQGSSGCTGGPSQSAEAGAAAPYWDSYTYNSVNDLTGQTSTPASGAATTTTLTYPAAGSAQPHAVSSQQTSGPSGDASSSYGYDAAGQLTSVASSSQAESLSWDDAGRLSSVTVTPQGGAAQTTSYTYDADGNLLLQQDPGSVTLFLPDEELVLNTSSGAVTGTRYYSIGGVTVVSRTSSGDVSYLAGDQQGTASVAIDASSLAVTRRYFDPYGNQIGTSPSSWPGAEGFVGGTADPATGLTDLGAREYSPGTGSFISPDPLLDPTDPQDLNPYAYASDNPSTLSDPSGQMSLLPGPGGGGGEGCKSYGIDCWSSNGNGGDGGGNGRGSDLGGAGGLGSGGDGGGCGYIGCGVTLPGSPAARADMLLQALFQPVLMFGPKPARKVITNGSPADGCTVSLLRSAIPICRAADDTTNYGGGAQGALGAIGAKSSEASKALRAAKTDPLEGSLAGHQMAALRWNPELRDVAATGRSPAVEVAGWGLFGVGLAAGEYENYVNSDYRGHHDIVEATVETTADASIGYGLVGSGAEFGFAIGSLIAPGPGTLIGAGVGAAAGAVGAFFASGEANNIISRVWNW
jgi:RHS repeat-associated protein